MSKDNIVQVERLKKQTKRILDNKYYNLWMNHFKFGGLDREQKRFIMKQYWEQGKVSCGKIEHLEGIENLFFAPFTTIYFDKYWEPKIIEFVKIVPEDVSIPCSPQEVNKTACVGYCNSGRTPIRDLVSYYVDRMVDIELTLNTNILIQNVPFILGITPEKKMKADIIISKLLNHEPVIFADVEDINMIQAVVTSAPYVADKLRSLYYDYENQLYTLLGVDNTKFDSSNKQFQLTTELDSNIAEINAYANDIETCIQEFVDDINKTFNVSIKLENTIEESKSLYQEDEEFKQPTIGGQDNE